MQGINLKLSISCLLFPVSQAKPLWKPLQRGACGENPSVSGRSGMVNMHVVGIHAPGARRRNHWRRTTSAARVRSPLKRTTLCIISMAGAKDILMANNNNMYIKCTLSAAAGRSPRAAPAAANERTNPWPSHHSLYLCSYIHLTVFESRRPASQWLHQTVARVHIIRDFQRLT